MFPSDILAEIQVPLVQSLHKMNVPNGSHSGRIWRQSCAGSAQDEATTSAMLNDFQFVFLVVIFHGRHLQNLTAQFIFDRHSDRDSGPVCVIITQNEFFFSATLNDFSTSKLNESAFSAPAPLWKVFQVMLYGSDANCIGRGGIAVAAKWQPRFCPLA